MVWCILFLYKPIKIYFFSFLLNHLLLTSVCCSWSKAPSLSGRRAGHYSRNRLNKSIINGQLFFVTHDYLSATHSWLFYVWEDVTPHSCGKYTVYGLCWKFAIVNTNCKSRELQCCSAELDVALRTLEERLNMLPLLQLFYVSRADGIHSHPCCRPSRLLSLLSCVCTLSLA